MKVALLAGGLAVALLAGCAHRYDDSYADRNEHRYVAPTHYTYVAPATTTETRVVAIEKVGTDGKVIGVEPRVVTNTDGYRVTVRGNDGIDRTYIMSSLGDIRVGDRVRFNDGRLYPIG